MAMKLIVEVYKSYNKHRAVVHKLELESEWLNTNRSFTIVEYDESRPNYSMLKMAAGSLYKEQTSDYEASIIETINYLICQHVWYDELNSLLEQYYA